MARADSFKYRSIIIIIYLVQELSTASALPGPPGVLGMASRPSITPDSRDMGQIRK